MNWVFDTENKIYSRVSGILKSKLLKTYKNLYITRDNATPTKAQFPTIYITFIGASERGQTLDGTSINAVNMTAEVHIKTAKASDITSPFMTNNEIAWEVVEAFKTLGFNATMPNMATSNLDGVYESVSRYSRIIGQDDVLYTV